MLGVALRDEIGSRGKLSHPMRVGNLYRRPLSSNERSWADIRKKVLMISVLVAGEIQFNRYNNFECIRLS